MAAHPAHLAEPSQHDDDGGIVFPQHAPEVLGALSQRPLSGYVGLLLSVDTRLHMLEVPLPMESPRGAPCSNHPPPECPLCSSGLALLCAPPCADL